MTRTIPLSQDHRLFAALLLGIGLGALDLASLLRSVPGGEWSRIALDAALTLGRVLAATLLGTLWALPAGLAIGLHPRLSRLAQPVVQVVASFPAPMLFPAAVAGLGALGVGLGWGSVVLMLLGTQWYILFNVVAGASAIPADLREAARLYRMGPWQSFRALYAPAVFPSLLTGWVTAAGGAWNASIVSEYMSFRGRTLAANGLGAQISQAAASGQFAVLAASITVMAVMVALFNRFVWRRLHALGQRTFNLLVDVINYAMLELARSLADDHYLAEAYLRQAQLGLRTGEYFQTTDPASQESFAAARRCGDEAVEIQAMSISAFIEIQKGIEKFFPTFIHS